MAVLRDLAEVCHWVSVVKITPDAAEDPTISPDERSRGQAMAETLPMRVLSRMWQMLLKALDEVAMAPNAMMAAEMAVIRLTHVADLPSPEELVKKLQDATPPAGGPSGSRPAPSPGSTTAISSSPAQTHSRPIGPSVAQGQAAVALDTAALQHYARFEDVVALIEKRRDRLLYEHVVKYVRLAAYQPGRIEFTPASEAPTDLCHRLQSALTRWTGNRWAVSLVNNCKSATLFEIEHAAEIALQREVKNHPLVKAVIAVFPKASITKITTEEEKAQDAFEDALPEVDEEWDPFDDD
jgi:DNA polymerase-3 subunit gamma/tau